MMSIYDNVAYGSAHRPGHKADLDEIVERCLRRAALWDEVKDKLKASRGCRCRAGSSSACASRARSPWTPR